MIIMAYLHIVLGRFKQQTTEGEIAEAMENGWSFNALEGVDVMASGEVAAGIRHGDGPGDAFTHALVVRIADDDALERYRSDPRHKAVEGTSVPRYADIAIVDVRV